MFKQLNELLDLQAKDVEIGTAQLALSGISLWLQKIEVKIGLATLLVTALALALTVGAIPNPFQKPALSTPSVAISRMVKYAGLRAIEQKMVAAETVLVGDTLNAYSGASAGDHNDELFIVQGGDVTRAEGGIVDSVVPERPGMMHVISIRTREPMTAPQLGLMEIAFSELSIARPLESGLHAVWDATDVNYQWVTGRDGTEPEPNSTFTEAAVEFLTRLNDAFGEGNWSLAGRSFPVLPTEHSAAQSTAAVVAAE